MIHLKIILDTRRKKSDGTYPIVYRVTDVKKVSVIASGVSILEELWNFEESSIGRNHPNAPVLNASLSKKYYEIQKAIVRLEDEHEFSFEALKEALSDKPRLVTRNLSFYKFSLQLINEMLEVKRIGNAIVYRTAVNRLIDYSGNKDIKFRQIDYAFLDGFRRKLSKEGVKPNTIGNYFRSVRAIYNKAIKSKIVERSFYPFTEISIRTEKTAKRAVMKQDIITLSQLALKSHSREWHARNYFLLSFCLRGMSFTDMAYLTSSNISRGLLTYKRRKTHKDYTINLVPLAKQVFAYYQGSNAQYLLPIIPATILEDTLETKKIISQWIKTTNKWLKRLGEKCEIEMPLTTYVGRHTWATTAKRLGYSNELIAEAMGHEYGNKITNIYLDTFDQSVMDELNEKVVEHLEIKGQ